MTPLLALLLTAAPSPVEQAYRSLLEARGAALGERPSIAQRALPQAAFPGLTFVYVWGAADGGQRPLEPFTFALEGAALRVVRVEQTNLEPTGELRRVDRLWLCPLALEREVIASARAPRMARLSALQERRAKECEPLLERAAQAALAPHDAAWLNATALFLASLALEAPRVVPLSKPNDADPRLARLLTGKRSTGEAAWVRAPAPFVAWKAERSEAQWSGAGLVMAGQGAPWLLHLEASFDGAFHLTTRQLGFARQLTESAPAAKQVDRVGRLR